MAGTMIPLNSLTQQSLFELLYKIDMDMAEQVRSRRCPFCGGPLYYANYQRKPRGGPPDIEEIFETCFSLCCGNEGCRCRTKPPSVRFWGRRVYWAPVLLLVTALRQGRNPDVTLERIKGFCGLWRSTVNRWREHFRSIFPQSSQYHRLSGHLRLQPGSNHLFYDVLEQFCQAAQTPREALVNCLRGLLVGP